MSRLEWCAVAEPGLLKLRAQLKEETITKSAAYAALLAIVGKRRFDTDFAAAQKPCPPKRSPQLWAVQQWDAFCPRDDKRHRLYSGTDCIVIELAAELGLDEFTAELIGDRHRADGSVIPQEAR